MKLKCMSDFLNPQYKTVGYIRVILTATRADSGQIVPVGAFLFGSALFAMRGNALLSSKFIDKSLDTPYYD